MWTPEAFGNAHAEIYDELLRDLPDTEDTVNAMVNSGGRTLLEFGLGTGRLAIPMAARGLNVTSIEVAENMINAMKAKPGAEKVEVVFGDYTTCDLGRKFDIVLLSRNALLGSPDQDLQVMTLQSAARHVANDGKVYVDIGMPRINGSSDVQFGCIINDGVVFYQRYLNAVTQMIDFRRIIVGGGTTRVLSRAVRYVWPAELDLMARIAGLCLESRSADWRGASFDENSEAFISIYKKN
jgi:SAM-dependent methyltransferase